MRFLRKLFLYLLLLIVLATGAVILVNKYRPGNHAYLPFQKPCRTPLKYSIGPIDPRFNLTAKQLQDTVAQAAQVWEKASGLNLFQYDPSAPLQIKMVYDVRQQATNEAESLEADLNALNTKQATLDKQYSGLNSQYNQQLAALKTAIADYEKDLKDYNADVANWNKQGGAPPDEYDKLKKRKKDLDSRYDSLKNQEAELNKLGRQINAIAAQENKIVNNYNQEVTTFQNKYGGTQEFEKGVFDSAAGITIYQYKETDDLRMTLIHELGHALGLEHVQNPKSIMYYLMGEQDLDNPTLSADDLTALKNICQL